jgi:hypothetical protein
VRCTSLFVFEEDDHEPLINPKLQALLDVEVSSKREKGKLPETKDEDEVVKQENEFLKTTKLLKVQYSADEEPMQCSIFDQCNGQFLAMVNIICVAMQSIQKSRKKCNPI